MSDFFSALSAVSAVVAAFAALLGISNARKIKKEQEPKISASVQEIVYMKFPDTAGHKITIKIVNASPTPLCIAAFGMIIRGVEKCEVLDIPMVVHPYVQINHSFFVYHFGTNILDGRYDASLVVKTDKKDFAFEISECEQRNKIYFAKTEEEFKRK